MGSAPFPPEHDLYESPFFQFAHFGAFFAFDFSRNNLSNHLNVIRIEALVKNRNDLIHGHRDDRGVACRSSCSSMGANTGSLNVGPRCATIEASLVPKQDLGWSPTIPRDTFPPAPHSRSENEADLDLKKKAKADL